MTATVSVPAFKSTQVTKVIEPFVDEYNLLIVDRDPEEDKTKVPSAEELLNKARDNTQFLFNKIWDLKRTIVNDAICAELPEKEKYRLPREKPIPGKKEPTKWEKFAKEKGITKKNKAKKVYDEATGEWKPTWGYRRAKDDTKDWLIEVNDQQDPNVDYFAERIQNKKERIAKNNYQRMKNEMRSIQVKNKDKVIDDAIPIGVGGRTELATKKELTFQVHKTKVATASAGKFEPAMKGEKKPKLGIKRKFEPNVADVNDEKERQLKILGSLSKKKQKIDNNRIAASEQAIQKAAVAAGGENSAARREQIRSKKKRSASSVHRQQYYLAKKKGKAPPPKRAGKGRFGGKKK